MHFDTANVRPVIPRPAPDWQNARAGAITKMADHTAVDKKNYPHLGELQ
jgi:hypothetical protein